MSFRKEGNILAQSIIALRNNKKHFRFHLISRAPGQETESVDTS